MVVKVYISADELRDCDGLWTNIGSIKQAKAFLKGSQILRYIEDLDDNIQVDFYQKLGGLRVGDKETSGINFRKWEKDVYEANFGKRHRLFFLIKNNQCVLLHACQKQKNRTEGKDCENIRSRAKNTRKILEKSKK